MNDEIKEILDKTKRWCDLALDDKCNTVMYKYELVAILDYITNLQQENQRLKENKLTPDELVKLLNQELVRQNKDYKSRNEKAIEYIRNIKYCEWHTERDELGNIQSKKIETTLVNGSKLMDILQRSDKE